MSTIDRHIQQAIALAVGGDEVRSVTRILRDHMRDNAIEDRDVFLQEVIRQLRLGRPLQYILGYTWFYGRRIGVNQHVLIPRPETEELVDWLITDYKKRRAQGLRIVDVGTGSGCIAIALKSELGQAAVVGCDISEEALALARKNAMQEDLEVHFLQLDFLKAELPGNWDVIVSNPPYVSSQEMAGLPIQVRHFEPAGALTPAGDDALIFYRRLAQEGKRTLKEGGRVYVEMNASAADETDAIFRLHGYSTELRKDLQGKWRMLRAML